MALYYGSTAQNPWLNTAEAFIKSFIEPLATSMQQGFTTLYTKSPGETAQSFTDGLKSHPYVVGAVVITTATLYIMHRYNAFKLGLGKVRVDIESPFGNLVIDSSLGAHRTGYSNILSRLQALESIHSIHSRSISSINTFEETRQSQIDILRSAMTGAERKATVAYEGYDRLHTTVAKFEANVVAVNERVDLYSRSLASSNSENDRKFTTAFDQIKAANASIRAFGENLTNSVATAVKNATGGFDKKLTDVEGRLTDIEEKTAHLVKPT